ncbi:uncharacterized protein VTP21DRAFT_11554 [Calcarisporiella thermophila]|uniref:uncharacterized protein n=1 Tax=Calcarisporiella thermophila TaxID=911321 RepID=UPI003742B8DC
MVVSRALHSRPLSRCFLLSSAACKRSIVPLPMVSKKLFLQRQLQTTTESGAINSESERKAQKTEEINFSELNINPPNDKPSEILRAALSLVPEFGWENALATSVERMGLPSVARGMFPGGPADLVNYFLEDCRIRLNVDAKGKLEGLRTHEKIRLMCQVRLNMMRPYITKWPEALAIMAQPTQAATSLTHLQKLVDDMWYLAGDKSSDMNWYSKRATLAAVYSSTELFMTQDSSPDFQETFRFLDRRLEDVAILGKSVNEISNLMSFAARSALGIIESKGHRL